MKPVAIGLILSILFSSLPAKVWACGLNLCPMDHHEKAQNDEKSMPCHQQSKEQTKNVKKEKKSESIASHAACPCPDTYIDVAYIVESRYLFETSKQKLVQSTSFDIAKLKTKSDPIFRYRPPPPRGLARLQITLQVFLI